MAGNSDSNDPTPAAWDEARLQSFIDNKIEESASLDYKGAAALSAEKVREITKDVSAFANAAGGIIIYGIREHSDAARKFLPEKLDPVNRRDFSKERLEHIISSIQPRLSVVIHPVALTSAPDHVAYVVEIPQASVAHQAANLRYYKRHNFESVAMQDYEVRDINRRKVHPVVFTELRISIGKHGWENRLIWHVTNQSDVLANWISTVIEVPFDIAGRPARFKNGDLRIDDGGFTSWRLQPHIGSPPLYPRSDVMRDFYFTFAQSTRTEGPPLKCRDIIKFKTFADEMSPVEGSVALKDIIVISNFDTPPKPG
jgi:Putative DNA-binding domain